MLSGHRRIYLAYGSNLHPGRLQARVGPVQLLGTTSLIDWTLRFDKRGGDGSTKANLRPAPGTGFRAGVALYELDLEQLRLLDGFEGSGRGYETIAITVRIDDLDHEAFTYLAPSQWLSNALLPFDWYVKLIVEGARFHGFEAAIIQKLERQPVRIDDDISRARAELIAMGLTVPEHYQV